MSIGKDQNGVSIGYKVEYIEKNKKLYAYNNNVTCLI